MKAVKDALDKITSDIKEQGEKAIAEASKGVAMSEAQKTRVDEMLVKQGELLQAQKEIGARLDEVEQKAARRVQGQEEQKSIGQQFVESDGFKEFGASGQTRYKMGFKAVTSASNSAGVNVRADRIQAPPSMAMLAERRFTIRDLMAPGRTSSNAIEYVRQLAATNNAAIQTAEGAAKGQSDYTWELVTQAVRTIAHWVPASKQILDDAPMLQSMIDEQLVYGLKLVEETQLLMGSGTGVNLNGIYTQATAYSQPAGSYGGGAVAVTPIDIIRLAMLQVFLSDYQADGIVLNPTQWAAIETTKDTEGRYIIGNPADGAAPRLWRRPVVETQAMTTDKFLVGAFAMGSQIFDREDANVQISTEDQDNFIKNMVTIRAEERLASAVYRPLAFVKGDLGLIA